MVTPVFAAAAGCCRCSAAIPQATPHMRAELQIPVLFACPPQACTQAHIRESLGYKLQAQARGRLTSPPDPQAGTQACAAVAAPPFHTARTPGQAPSWLGSWMRAWDPGPPTTPVVVPVVVMSAYPALHKNPKCKLGVQVQTRCGGVGGAGVRLPCSL